ncbi:uncharacterized protein [Aristolochia californica]|uniref:uncharacterized protein n=1 Tax=Aristolochia californica TaxID=171875 RepID=UPI0035E379E9
MSLVLLPCFSSSRFLSLSSSPAVSPSFRLLRSTYPNRSIYAELPARDRVIDFGKYKGRMLGTLPSTYLKWVTKNLRARDYEEWAKLADEVLHDPYYKDRLEWEHAESILQGNDSRRSTSAKPVADLLEISERFGWDNDDKIGWKGVDFALLGTSKGGRIPRIMTSEGELRAADKGLGLREKYGKGIQEMSSGDEDIDYRRNTQMGSVSRGVGISNIDMNMGRNRLSRLDFYGRNSAFRKTEENNRVTTEPGSLEKKKVGYLKDGFRYYDADEAALEVENVKAKREERRERQRLQRELQMKKVKKEIGVKEDEEYKGIQGRALPGRLNPFPGRESLLRKIRRPD